TRHIHTPSLHAALPISAARALERSSAAASGRRPSRLNSLFEATLQKKTPGLAGGSKVVRSIARRTARRRGRSALVLHTLAEPDRSEEHTSELQSRENLV